MSRKTAADTAQDQKKDPPPDLVQAARITPTIVLVCGAIGEREATALKEQVFRRLDSQIPPGFVGWTQVPEVSGKDLSALKQTVTDLVRPFLKFRYIKDLWEQSFAEDDVRRHFLASIPDGNDPYQPQVIVIYWGAGEDATVATSSLANLETALKDTFSGRASPMLTLIATGDSLPDLSKETLFWPRFRLQNRTAGGFDTDDPWLIESCQNLSLALITSELRHTLVERFGSKRKWLWVGTSAIAVDLHAMHELVRHGVIRDLIAPVLAQEERAEAFGAIQHDVRFSIEQLQTDMLISGLSTATNEGWDFKTLPPGRIIADANLNTGADLRTKIFRPDNDLAGIIPPEFRRGTLFDDYRDLRDALRRQVPVVAGKAFTELVRYLRSLLMVPAEPPSQEGAASSADVLSSASQGIEEVAQDESTLEEQPPRGLKAGAEAAKRAAGILSKSSDLEKRGLYHHRIGIDEYLSVVGELDEEAIGLADLRYKRFRRTGLSPLGLTLKLLPAWPLLTALLFAFLQWDEWLAAVVAGILLAALGVIEHLMAENAVTKSRQILVSEIEQKIACSVLGIVAKVLWDYRLQMVARLREVSRALNDLYTALAKEHTHSSGQAARWERHLTELDKDRGAVYWLADPNQCQTWISAAVDKSRIRGLELMRLVDAEILVKKQPASYRSIFARLTRHANVLVNDTFEESKLLPLPTGLPEIGAPAGKNGMTDDGMVRFRYPLLKQAKIWEWLYQIAQPLGKGSGDQLNTIGIEEPKAITGAAGQLSEFFKQRKFNPTLSRQKHEIICIRISAEST